MCDENNSLTSFYAQKNSAAEVYPMLSDSSVESYASNPNQGWCSFCSFFTRRIYKPTCCDKHDMFSDTKGFTKSLNWLDNENTAYKNIAKINIIRPHYDSERQDSFDIKRYFSYRNVAGTAKDHVDHNSLINPWVDSSKSSDGEIPAIVMVLMIVLACLITLAVCLAVYGIVNYRRKRSNGRTANQSNATRQHLPSVTDSRNLRSNTPGVNTLRNENVVLEDIFRIDENMERASAPISQEVPPAYEDIVALDEKTLPTYEEFLEHTRSVPSIK